MADPGRSDEPEAFVSNLPLTAVFGTHPKTRIVGALLTENADPPTAFSSNEVARISGLDEEAVEEHVGDLLEIGVVVETDEIEEGAYVLDDERDVIASIRRLNDELAGLVFPADG